MAMGCFSGNDPAPTLSRLQTPVSSGQLRFVLLGDGGPGRAGSDIQQWEQANGTLVDPTSYGGSSGQQLYDLATASAANPA